VQNNQFGYNITGTNNYTVVAQTCPNLASPVWTPLARIFHRLVHNSRNFSGTGRGRWSKLTFRCQVTAFPAPDAPARPSCVGPGRAWVFTGRPADVAGRIQASSRPQGNKAGRRTVSQSACGPSSFLMSSCSSRKYLSNHGPTQPGRSPAGSARRRATSRPIQA
jgi:hypothetical protein